MDEMDALFEIARQMSIKNRLQVASELYHMEHYDPYEYIDILKSIEDDLMEE